MLKENALQPFHTPPNIVDLLLKVLQNYRPKHNNLTLNKEPLK